MMARLQLLKCKGLCADSCGPILPSSKEMQEIRRFCRERNVPYSDLRERFPGAKKAASMGPAFINEHPEQVFCPYLSKVAHLQEDAPFLFRCQVYEVRPLVCRLWGAVEGMECPHGCWPKGEPLLTRVEAMEALHG